MSASHPLTVCAVMVDASRMLVYGLAATSLTLLTATESRTLVLAATAAAFTGAYLGKRLIAKTTLPAVQRIVAAGLIILGIGITTGLL